jgi:hypothetical protein
MKATLTAGAALRIVKNERLLCVNCLSSGEGPNEKSVYCFLSNGSKLKNKEQFCDEGTWLINGKVVGFKEGFQMLYDSDKSVAGNKEIKT